MRLKVKARNTKEVALDFFVIDGPNNLLGRYGLEKLWPSEYNVLRNVATENAAVLQQQRKIGIPGVGGPLSTGSSNEVHNSRRIPSVGEHKSGTVAANEVHNSSRSVGGADTNIIGIMRTSVGADASLSDATAEASIATALPEKRNIPPFPVGEITQEVGERYCKLICDTYPEVFDGEKGNFRGAEATMFVKKRSHG